MSLLVRAARPSDLDRLIEIHTSAFPDPRDATARRRNFADNPLGGLEDLHVAERDGRLVAHAFLFRLRVWFGGKEVHAGGIASLGVAPEERGAGVASAMMTALHAAAQERGDALTLLYPFRQAFYERHGYANVAPYVCLEFHPSAVPRAWADDGAGRPRAATGADVEPLREVYRMACPRAAGVMTRPDALWNRRLQDERCHWITLERDRAVVGAIAFRLEQRESHAETSLVVEDLFATDDAGRRRLIAVLGAQRDQVHKVILAVPHADPLGIALVDADRGRGGTERLEHPLGTLAAGPMVRLTDTRRAISARGYGADGEIDLWLPDEGLGVCVTRGVARTGPVLGGPHLRLEPTTLAGILYGSLGPRAAASLGKLETPLPDALALAERLFTTAPFFSRDPF